MPTGLTQPLCDGQDMTFEQYAKRIATQFVSDAYDRGADYVPPRTLNPSDDSFYHDMLRDAQDRLRAIRLLSTEACQRRADAAYDELVERYYERQHELEDGRERFAELRAKVLRFEPPTEEHERFAELMLEQIDSTVEWDYRTNYYTLPNRIDGETWRKQEIAAAENEIERATQHIEDDRLRFEKRNQWVASLYDSIAEVTASLRAEGIE